MNPVEILIVGAGSRGSRYAKFALENPELCRVTAVAEPREYFRERLGQQHGIGPARLFSDWRELADRPKLADAVIIATKDADHLAPAEAFARQGYAILLEKPLAPDPESCRRITEAALANDIILAVCHVLRYTSYTQKLKQLLDSGLIGDIVSVHHLEPVGFWHYAHSFVRGNWRNQAETSFMLLAKSCHDIDWLRYIIGQPCLQVSSFGSLKHFRKEQKPPEAGEAKRCLSCAYEPDCPYSAKRIYLGFLHEGRTDWPLDVITTDFTEQGVITALEEGPYGRCVYECDNDVVDHQVVNLLYEKGITATFTMVGTSELRFRETLIFGTRGEIRGDGDKLVHYDFLTGRTEEIITTQPDDHLSGHGGGDFAIMKHFVAAVAQKNPALILSGPLDSLETHLTVFAAEQSRLEGRTVQVK
jgi:predicted dehydrogenase